MTVGTIIPFPAKKAGKTKCDSSGDNINFYEGNVEKGKFQILTKKPFICSSG